MRDITDQKIVSVRSAAILTNSYVAGTVATQTRALNQLVVLLQFTIGSLTSMEMKVEFSNDNSTYYQETIDAPNSLSQYTSSVGERTFTATGNYSIAIPVAYNFIKISVKGTGTTTDSSCTVDAVLART